jgi:hypothetical protein
VRHNNSSCRFLLYLILACGGPSFADGISRLAISKSIDIYIPSTKVSSETCIVDIHGVEKNNQPALEISYRESGHPYTVHFDIPTSHAQRAEIDYEVSEFHDSDLYKTRFCDLAAMPMGLRGQFVPPPGTGVVHN